MPDVLRVDEDDNPLGREQLGHGNYWGRACGVLIVNPKTKQILCQRRADSKKERPGVWVSMFGGKSDPGELPAQTTLRELREECSIELTQKQLHFFIKVKSVKHRQFEYLFWAMWHGDIKQLSYDEAEVAEVGWFGIDTVIQNMTSARKDWYLYSDGELAMIKDVKQILENKA